MAVMRYLRIGNDRYEIADEKLKVSEITSGITYYPILGSGIVNATSSRQWDSTGLQYDSFEGEEEGEGGSASLSLGNYIPVGETGSKRGNLILYGEEGSYSVLQSSTTGEGTGYYILLPDKQGTVALTDDIPTKVSQLENDLEFITEYTETDPTVPAWAKARTKPTYTAQEVGAIGSVTVSRALVEGTKSATITVDGTSYDIYSKSGTITNIKTTAGAHTTIDVSSGAVSFNIPTTAAHVGIKFGYTTSGNNRAVLQDSSGNLYVTQKDDNTNTTYTLSGALSSHKFTSTLTAGGSGSGTSTSELTFVAGTGITLTDDATNKKITIAASNNGTVTSVAASGSGGITISGSPITTSGTITIGLNLSTAINGLGEGTSPATINDYAVVQYAGGGTTTTTYHRRKLSNLIVGKAVSDQNGLRIDTGYLKLTGGSVTGPTTFGDTVSIDDLNAGQLVINGSASVANNLQVNTINGYTLSTAKDNNSIAVRTANGYLYASYLNQSSAAETPTTSSYIIYANSDGFLRKSTLANIKTILGLGSNAYTSTAYLPLAGGTMTGNINFKNSGIDASKANNNVSSTVWPTTFNIQDTGGRIMGRVENVVQADGQIGLYAYVRNYDTSGAQVAQKGIGMYMAKDGTFTYSVSDPAKFTSAISALPLSGGTITGILKTTKPAQGIFAAATYGGTGNTTKIKIKINSTVTWMLSFVVTLYQGYRATKVMISGYQYGSNYWHQPEARLIADSDGTETISVYFGYDSANNLWVGFDGGNYTGVAITDVVNGYTQITDYSNLFTISNVSTFGGTTQTTVTAASKANYANSAGTATTCSYPAGFASRSTGATWGNTTGTSFTAWNDPTGGSIDFRQDNPSSGKVSIKVDGRFYFNEGNTPAAGLKSANGYWGLTGPDGEDNVWIRGTSLGFIPYQGGAAGSGHGSIGTSSWYWSAAYIDHVYGTLSGNASSADATVLPRMGNANTIDSKSAPSQYRAKVQEYGPSCLNLPTSAWYFIQTWRGADNNYCAQLALGETTDDGYFRILQNNTWGSWRRITTGARNITMSTSGPSGGSNGDLWFTYTA